MATAENASSKYDKSFFGHPAGLSTLFFTEMWERFSYYGMRALLVLYMVAAVSEGGLGFETADATAIYGLYTASVYFLPLIGGWFADRFIGAKRATLIGGVIIAAGHFALAVPTLTFFYLGLVLVAIGTGFLKSNISAMVGDLYDKDDERRDGGFTIFYMGINLGAFAAPLITGALAAYNWHWGFAAAGVGMVAGLIQYVIGGKKLEGVGEPPVKTELDASAITPLYLAQVGGVIVASLALLAFLYSSYGFDFAIKSSLVPILVIGGLIVVIFTGMQDKLSVNDWKRLGIIIILFLFAALFWAGFEQAGSSFNLFAEQLTERTVGTFEVPAAWFQSINAIMIVMLAPLFSIMWVKWGKKQPNDVFKFGLGLFFLALGFVVMAYASGLTGAGKVSPMWLVLVYLLHTIGELFLSPVGLSSMTKLAPGKMVGLMLGVWFLAASFGSFAAGQIAGEFEAKQETLVNLFWNLSLVIFGGAAVAIVLSFIVGGFLKSRQKTVEVPVEPA
ncbi:MAG: peptide MFS transporter [Acidobacteriota bacterium]|jgi:POT family proton-dependent oligopeptide transporter|nr:peptide MFS transporter [Acidobacteriota bacterium]